MKRQPWLPAFEKPTIEKSVKFQQPGLRIHESRVADTMESTAPTWPPQWHPPPSQQGLGIQPFRSPLRHFRLGPADSFSHPVPSSGMPRGDGKPRSALVQPTSDPVMAKIKLQNESPARQWSQPNTRKRNLGSKTWVKTPIPQNTTNSTSGNLSLQYTRTCQKYVHSKVFLVDDLSWQRLKITPCPLAGDG